MEAVLPNPDRWRARFRRETRNGDTIQTAVATGKNTEPAVVELVGLEAVGTEQRDVHRESHVIREFFNKNNDKQLEYWYCIQHYRLRT